MTDFIYEQGLWVGIGVFVALVIVWASKYYFSEKKDSISKSLVKSKVQSNTLDLPEDYGSAPIAIFGNDFMTISRVDAPTDTLQIIDNAVMMKTLSPALQPLTQVLFQQGNLGGTFVKIAFKPELIEGIASGKLEVMQSVGVGIREMVVDSRTRKIVGHGKFFLETGPNAAALASIGFQTVSFAVGQAHMAQITEKLKTIEEGVENITKFLEEQRQSKLLASIGRLRSIALVLGHPDATTIEKTSWFEQLLSLEAEMSELFQHFKIEAVRQRENLKKLTTKDTFGTGDTFQEIRKRIEAFASFYDGWISSYVLMSSSRFIMLRNSSRGTILAISDKIDSCDIDKEIGEFNETLALASSLSTKMLSSSFWNTEETLEERRKKIKDRIDPIFFRLGKDAAKTKEWIKEAQAHRAILQAALNDGLDLFVELDERGNSRKLFLNRKL